MAGTQHTWEIRLSLTWKFCVVQAVPFIENCFDIQRLTAQTSLKPLRKSPSGCSHCSVKVSFAGTHSLTAKNGCRGLLTTTVLELSFYAL